MNNNDFEMKKANYVVFHVNLFFKSRAVEVVYTYSLHDAHVFLFSEFNEYWNSLSGYGKVWDPKTNTRELVKVNVKDKTICLLNYMKNFHIYDCKNQEFIKFLKSGYDEFYPLNSKILEKTKVPNLIYDHYLKIKYIDETYNYPIMKIENNSNPISSYKYRHPKSHTIKSYKDIWYIQSTYRRKNEIRFKRDEDEDIYLTPRQRNAENRFYKNSQCGRQHNVGVSWKRHTKNRKAWAKHKGKAHYEKPSKMIWKDELKELDGIYYTED